MKAPELHKLLYVTIKNFEMSEGIRLGAHFDGFAFLATAINHKNPSTLRKMCLPPEQSNGAKLGLNEARIIMRITRDYRLLNWLIYELKADQPNPAQFNLFAQPITQLEELNAEVEA